MPFKKWEIARPDPELSGILAEECGISPLAASVLTARGHGEYADACRFLTASGALPGEPGETLSSPFELADMKKAAERLRRAVDDYEKITIYGDYDCDGVTATAMLYTYLSSTGANVSYYIPEREGEGYGMNAAAVKKLAAEGTKLLVTVDNGISASDEIALANTLGMEVIVTDHHQPGESLPPAYAVVNPHRGDCGSEFKELAGVGVAFKLVAAMEEGDYQFPFETFADIVALGTVGDVVPLVGENRLLVKRGLRALAMSDNAGLLALLEVAGVDASRLTAQTLSFSLVPRINAAGRIGEAGLAVRLLLAEDGDEAAALAARLDEMNKQRQSSEADIITDAEQMLEQRPELLTRRLLILKNEGWSHGIIGIVCSKLVERYGKPVLLMSSDGAGGLKGSARSVGEFHLFKALAANAAWLSQYGGHKMAAGFSLKETDFNAFVSGMEEYARKVYERMPRPVLRADGVLTPDMLTLEDIGSLAVLEPFGAQNEPPVFLLEKAELSAVTPLSGGKHQRLSLRADGKTVTALLFGVPSQRFSYLPGDLLDLLVNAEINSFNGTQSVSLKVKDLRPSGFSQDQFFAAKDCYEKLCRGEPVAPAMLGRAAPTREEAALVYRLLKSAGGWDGELDFLYLRLAKHMNYCKLRILLDVLEESGLIAVWPVQNRIELKPADGKADLTAASSWKRVHGG